MILLDGFATVESIAKNFDTKFNDEIIIFGLYDIDGYEGSAWVVFLKNEKLYEVHGFHCSCYGLEGQWSPEETSADAIIYRINNNGHATYKKHHEDILRVLMPLTLQRDLDKSLPVNEDMNKKKPKI